MVRLLKGKVFAFDHAKGYLKKYFSIRLVSNVTEIPFSVKKNVMYSFNRSRFESFMHSHKKRKVSLEGSLNQVLYAAELVFPKILVPRLPQNSSHVNIECTGKSKTPSLCDQLLLCIIYVTSFL